jgi:hypothetical protein
MKVVAVLVFSFIAGFIVGDLVNHIAKKHEEKNKK